MNSQLTIESFSAHRQFLVSIAYRMLGRLSEVDDMVQEVWLRWQTQDAAGILSPKAWLGSAMRRLCIDQLRSARHQREDQYGVLLPDPLSAATHEQPDISVELEYSLTTAFALILESLRPVERVVFLLREVFDYDYADTAAIVGKEEANCRQIVRRAKAQLLANSTPPPQHNERARHLVKEFISAATTGEVSDLLALLEEDATLNGDGADRVKEMCRRNTPAPMFRVLHRTVIPATHTPRVSCARASKPLAGVTSTSASSSSTNQRPDE